MAATEERSGLREQKLGGEDARGGKDKPEGKRMGDDVGGRERGKERAEEEADGCVSGNRVGRSGVVTVKEEVPSANKIGLERGLLFVYACNSIFL